MKKLFVAVLALTMLVAFAATSYAFEVKFGARVRVDYGYNITSSELTENGEDDIIRGFFSVPSSSYFRSTFTSKDKKVGVRIEMGMGNTMNRRPVFGWYTIGNCKLVAGFNYTWAGDSTIGHASWLMDLTSGGMGLNYFGRMPMIAIEWRSGNMGVQVGVFEPQGSSPSGSGAQDFGWYLPQLHVTGDFKFSSIRIVPQFAVSTYTWEATTGDSNFTAWFVGLPVQGTFGPVTLNANLFYSINGAADFGQNAMATPVSVNGSIENATSYGGFFEASYKAGATTITLGLGGVKVQNDGWTKAGGLGYTEDSVTQYKGYLHVNYQLHANLALRPEIGYVSYGDSPTNGEDAGNEWRVGLRFQFVF